MESFSTTGEPVALGLKPSVPRLMLSATFPLAIEMVPADQEGTLISSTDYSEYWDTRAVARRVSTRLDTLLRSS